MYTIAKKYANIRIFYIIEKPFAEKFPANGIFLFDYAPLYNRTIVQFLDGKIAVDVVQGGERGRCASRNRYGDDVAGVKA